MHVCYTGNPRDASDATTTVVFGVAFHLGHPVDVSHLSEVHRRKLANNQYFKVLDGEATADAVNAAAGAAIEPVAARAPERVPADAAPEVNPSVTITKAAGSRGSKRKG